MPKKDYDKKLFRLMQILTKVSNGERPNSRELAQDFGVSMRTIQKDINQTLYNFPIIKDEEGRFVFYDGFSLKRTILDNDELMFLNLALSQFDEVADIDKVKSRIFKKLINNNFYNPYYIKQDDIEDLDIDSPKIECLERLIKEHAIVELELKNTTTSVELYKIANFEGFWYLFAKDLSDNKTKTFKLSSIVQIHETNRHHQTPNETIESILDKTHSAFYKDGNSFEVTVKVHSEIAEYFKHKDFLESQKIIDEYEDGALKVSFEISHDEDVDNIIKSWLPHIEVLEPARFKKRIINELKEYILRVDT